MTKWILAAIGFTAMGLQIHSAVSDADLSNLPRLRGATLLVGFPPSSLVVTTNERVSQLQSGGPDWFVNPSMSRDGRFIASARPAEEFAPGSRIRLKLKPSIYSSADQTWKDYQDVRIFDGTVAISPDGTKLACITREKAGVPGQISIIELRTGRIALGVEGSRGAGYNVGWSPDAKRIVFEKKIPRTKLVRSSAIYILDPESGSVTKIADGRSPSWSPSGEWIAFYDSDTNTVSLIRPNGTDRKALRAFEKDESLTIAPVWSPDSQVLLVNKFRDWNNSKVDVYALEVATKKMTKKFKDVPPIFAWAPTE